MTVYPGGRPASSRIELPLGGVVLSGARRTEEMTLARFGTGASYRLQPPHSNRLALLRIPRDPVSIPWKLLIVGAKGPIQACAVAESARQP